MSDIFYMVVWHDDTPHFSEPFTSLFDAYQARQAERALLPEGARIELHEVIAK